MRSTFDIRHVFMVNLSLVDADYLWLAGYSLRKHPSNNHMKHHRGSVSVSDSTVNEYMNFTHTHNGVISSFIFIQYLDDRCDTHSIHSCQFGKLHWKRPFSINHHKTILETELWLNMLHEKNKIKRKEEEMAKWMRLLPHSVEVISCDHSRLQYWFSRERYKKWTHKFKACSHSRMFSADVLITSFSADSFNCVNVMC